MRWLVWPPGLPREPRRIDVDWPTCLGTAARAESLRMATEPLGSAACTRLVLRSCWFHVSSSGSRINEPQRGGRKMTIALGNGAEFSAPVNLRRPRSRRISEARLTYLCHHRVSVRAGTRQTTSSPVNDDSNAFLIQFAMARPYGGFIQQTPDHRCARPSFSSV